MWVINRKGNERGKNEPYRRSTCLPVGVTVPLTGISWQRTGCVFGCHPTDYKRQRGTTTSRDDTSIGTADSRANGKHLYINRPSCPTYNDCRIRHRYGLSTPTYVKIWLCSASTFWSFSCRGTSMLEQNSQNVNPPSWLTWQTVGLKNENMRQYGRSSILRAYLSGWVTVALVGVLPTPVPTANTHTLISAMVLRTTTAKAGIGNAPLPPNIPPCATVSPYTGKSPAPVEIRWYRVSTCWPIACGSMSMPERSSQNCDPPLW